MKILIACEESQTVCAAFRQKGHMAFSCDIIHNSGGKNEWHIKSDCKPLLNGECEFETEDGTQYFIDKWDMIIAHPPCTYLSKAGARHLYRVDEEGRRYINAYRFLLLSCARDFFMDVLNSDCPRIAIENPTPLKPLKIANLPKPTQIIQPYYFGDPFSKRTLLWLKNLPPLQPTDILKEFKPFCPSNTSNFSKGGGGSFGVARTQKERSKTFPGIAAAMADQWG